MTGMVNADTDLKIRNLTIDYTSGHALIDGRPIGTFVANPGPEVLASPAKGLYLVNVPLMVKSVTFLPSGQTFEPTAGGLAEAFRRFAAAFGPADPRVSVEDVRLALVQALPTDSAARTRVLELLANEYTVDAGASLAEDVDDEREFEGSTW